jgi:hypothetical protein
MTDTFIVINRHIIAANRKNGGSDPPIRITRGKNGKPRYASRIRTLGPVELFYDPREPVMPCGAQLALRTSDGVEILE